jgi:CubicO group peptidase (beta-lactamase class C family)
MAPIPQNSIRKLFLIGLGLAQLTSLARALPATTLPSTTLPSTTLPSTTLSSTITLSTTPEPQAQRRGAPGPGTPAGTVSYASEIEDLVKPYLSTVGAPGKAIGLVVGVSHGNGRMLFGFGARTVNGSTPPNGDDIFEIGSVTKVFTGFLLARAVEQGTATLDTVIDPWFPAGSPDFNGQSITWLDLATHTSGLPNYPSNLNPTVPGNPASGYTAQNLASFMAGYTLNLQPGTHFLYSNLGSGVLGHVLVQACASTDYEALVRREIADPLGMADTRIVLSPTQQLRRVQGYAGPNPAPFNVIGEPLAGGGALRSSARDLLLFVDAAIGHGPAAAVSTWQDVLLPQRRSPFGDEGASGLLINSETHAGRRLYSKSGGTAGFSSQICFTSTPPVAVVLLANSRDVQGLQALGRELVDRLSKP